MVAALVEASRSVGQTFTSLQDSFNDGVGLVLLEKLIGVDIRVLIIKANDSTYVNQIWAHMIHKGTSIDVSWERPVYSVLN
jgi:hypothetical protein